MLQNPPASPSEKSRKALIILEQSSSAGSTFRELATMAEQWIPNRPDLRQRKAIEAYNRYIKLLEEELEANRRFDDKRHQRAALEKLAGDVESVYKESPEWQKLNTEVKVLDSTVTQLSRQVNTINSLVIEFIIKLYAEQGIDILLYDAPDRYGMQMSDRADPKLLTAIKSKIGRGTFYEGIVIGGGHGSPEVLSGLAKPFVQLMVRTLQHQEVKTNLICLGSCEGATHMPYFKPLLRPTGMTIGYLGDCTNTFAMALIQYRLGMTDELIPVDPFAEESEAHAKSSSLAIMHGDTITGFQLARPAQSGPFNQDYWNDSFVHLFFNQLQTDEEKLTGGDVIDPNQIRKIFILGDQKSRMVWHAFQGQGPLTHLFQSSKSKLTEDLVGEVGEEMAYAFSTDPKQRQEILQQFLSTKIKGDVKSGFAKRLGLPASEAPPIDIMTEWLVDKLPSIHLLPFAEDTNKRLYLFNGLVAKIVAPTDSLEDFQGLQSPPISPAVALHSLTLNADDFKDEIDKEDKPQKSISIKGK